MRNTLKICIMGIGLGLSSIYSITPYAAAINWQDCNINNNNSDMIVSACTRILLQNPNSRPAYSIRGLTFDKKGDYAHAIADYDQVIRLDPLGASHYNARGVAFDKKADYEHALADFTQAIHLNPRFVQAYKNRAFAYQHLGNVEDAKADNACAVKLETGGSCGN